MAGYTDAIKYGNAQTVFNACSVAQANGDEWPNMPSGYFNKGADYSWENLTICRLASLAKAWDATGWCANGFINAAGQDVPKPSVCNGGTAPNDLVPYDPVAAALANKEDELSSLAAKYAELDNSKKIIVAAIIIALIALVLGGVYIIW